MDAVLIMLSPRIRMEIWWWERERESEWLRVCVCVYMCDRLWNGGVNRLEKGIFCILFYLSMFWFWFIFFFFWVRRQHSNSEMEEIWSCIVYSNNRLYSPKEQLGDDCSWSVCCICCCGCCSDDDCCDNCDVSMFDGDKNSECAWLCGCCGCWNWKCCCDVNRSMWWWWSGPTVSMLWYWPLWFGFILRLAASRLLRDCFDGSSQLSNILIDVDGSSNRNNPFVTQLPVKCCAVWFACDSGCDWLCWLFWDCFATSKIVAIYNIRGQTGLTNRFDFQTTISLSILDCVVRYD